MKKASFPQKKKALLWGGLALACLLLFLLLRGLDNAPSLTLEQTLREAERQNCTAQTTVLDTKTLDNTTFSLTGNQDVLMLVPFYRNPLVRLREASHTSFCFDLGASPFDPAQGAGSLCGFSMDLEDEGHDRLFACLLGATQLPEAATVKATAALSFVGNTAEDETLPTLWTGTAPVKQSPYGYGFFWLWTELPPTGANNYYVYTLTLFDQAGNQLAALGPRGFSSAIRGYHTIY